MLYHKALWGRVLLWHHGKYPPFGTCSLSKTKMTCLFLFLCFIFRKKLNKYINKCPTNIGIFYCILTYRHMWYFCCVHWQLRHALQWDICKESIMNVLRAVIVYLPINRRLTVGSFLMENCLIRPRLKIERDIFHSGTKAREVFVFTFLFRHNSHH